MKKKILSIIILTLFIVTIVTPIISVTGNIIKIKNCRELYTDYYNLMQRIIDVNYNNNWSEQAKLLASDGENHDSFGLSVSLNNNYALIGARGDNNDEGAAYVFIRTGSTWTEQAKLLASDGATDDKFGFSVSLDDNYALIGAYEDDDNGYNSGSAYVFTRSGSTWSQQAKLTASDGAKDDWFGYSVSIDGDSALIGARLDDDNGYNSGSAYVFTRSGSTWSQQAKLLASDGASNDKYSWSISIDGDSAIIGAYEDDDNGIDSGSAYVFTRSGSTWSQQAKLLASDGASNDSFGISVSINEDSAIIGAHTEDNNDEDSGSAYVFTRSGSTWTEQAKLLASDSDHWDWFGRSVSIKGDSVIIGASRNDDSGTESGSAYIFTRNDSTWTEQTKLLASDGTSWDWFGLSSSIDGNYTLVGAWGDDDNGDLSGSVYVYAYGNQPPYAPSNPDPDSGETDVNIDVELSWSGGDPDGDNVTYDIYFGTTSPPINVVSNQSDTTYDPGILDFDTKYYWQIVAWSSTDNLSVSGLIWSFTTEENLPPNTPGNPNPSDGATDVPILKILSWTGGDPNSGDTVTYDVYFGKSSPPQLITEDISETSYDPDTMDLETTYYWQIVAEDSQSESATGQIWSFTTELEPNEPPTAPDIDGPNEGSAGEELCWDFHSDDPEENQIKYIIDWGDENSSQTGFNPPCTPVEACHTYNEDGEFIISATAEDEKGLISEESTFTVKVKTPRSRATYNSLFNWLLARFPLLERLLNLIKVI